MDTVEATASRGTLKHINLKLIREVLICPERKKLPPAGTPHLKWNTRTHSNIKQIELNHVENML